MKKFLLLFALILISSINSQSSTNQSSSPQITYQVDLTNYKDDLFHVTVLVEKLSDDTRPALGIGSLNMLPTGEFIVPSVGRAKEYGMENCDIILNLLGIEVTQDNIRSVIDSAYSMNVGNEFDPVIKRNNEKIELKDVLMSRIDTHIFGIMENPTPEQIFLREKWLKNSNAE